MGRIQGKLLKSKAIWALPDGVVGHLSHYLAVDLVPEGVVLGGWAEDLVGQFYGVASVFDGVVAHVLQDRWQTKLKNKSLNHKKYALPLKVQNLRFGGI